METLVSVGVITYNSEKYITETLQSVYDQSYRSIELIISDDASLDNTLKKVNDWLSLKNNSQRFAQVKLITVKDNTGVSANCNRVINAASGEWIKFIAGDDILFADCIQLNMDFIENTPEAKIVFSQVDVYQETFDKVDFKKTIPSSFPENIMHESFTAKEQYEVLLRSDRINYTPSYFFNKKSILSVGGYDETNKLVEDYPMWLKLTKAGFKLNYFHKPTVGYRIHDRATNNTGDQVLFKPSVLNSHNIRVRYAHPYLPRLEVYKENWTHHTTKLFHIMGFNKNTRLNKSTYLLLTVFLNPFVYLLKLSLILK